MMEWIKCTLIPPNAKERLAIIDPLPVDGTENMHKLHAVATRYYVVPFRHMLVDVNKIYTGKSCPPELSWFLREWLDYKDVVTFARVAARVARMHAKLVRCIIRDDNAREIVEYVTSLANRYVYSVTDVSTISNVEVAARVADFAAFIAEFAAEIFAAVECGDKVSTRRDDHAVVYAAAYAKDAAGFTVVSEDYITAYADAKDADETYNNDDVIDATVYTARRECYEFLIAWVINHARRDT